MYILYESPRLESTHLAHIVHWGNKLVGKFRSTTALVLGYHRGGDLFPPRYCLGIIYVELTYNPFPFPLTIEILSLQVGISLAFIRQGLRFSENPAPVELVARRPTTREPYRDTPVSSVLDSYSGP